MLNRLLFAKKRFCRDEKVYLTLEVTNAQKKDVNGSDKCKVMDYKGSVIIEKSAFGLLKNKAINVRKR